MVTGIGLLVIVVIGSWATALRMGWHPVQILHRWIRKKKSVG